ncbi:MAG: 50S ribosomal protein L24 [bacterium]
MQPAKQKRSIKKNDIVMVIKGREKGKSGKVIRVLPEKEKAVVERLNFIKRHARPSQQLRQGGIIQKEAPLPLSNLMLLCPKCNKPVRIGRKLLEDGQKVRFCKKCGDLFEK